MHSERLTKANSELSGSPLLLKGHTSKSLSIDFQINLKHSTSRQPASTVYLHNHDIICDLSQCIKLIPKRKQNHCSSK